MSDDDDFDKFKGIKNHSPKRHYEVGYGKPPKSTRFVKGRSGNPKGRPKGAKNHTPALHEERFKTILMEEAYRPVKVTEGSKEITIPIAQAIVRSMAVNAVRGDQRSQKAFTDRVSWVEADNKAHYDEYAQAMLDYKFDWEREIERRKELGLPIPELILHPDEITVDEETGLIKVTGTFNREEKERREKIKDQIRKRKQEALKAIAIYKADMEDPKNAKVRHLIQDEIDFEQSLYERLSLALGDKTGGDG